MTVKTASAVSRVADKVSQLASTGSQSAQAIKKVMIDGIKNLKNPKPPTETTGDWMFVSQLNKDTTPVDDKPLERLTDGDIARGIIDKITLPPKGESSDLNMDPDVPEDFEFITALGRSFDSTIKNFSDNINFPMVLLRISLWTIFTIVLAISAWVLKSEYESSVTITDPLWRRPFVYVGILSSLVPSTSELAMLLVSSWFCAIVTIFGVLFTVRNTIGFVSMLAYWMGFRYSLYSSLIGHPYKYEVRYKCRVPSHVSTHDARPDAHRQGELRYKDPQLCMADVVITMIESGPGGYQLNVKKHTVCISMTLLNQLSSLKCFSRSGDLTTICQSIDLAVKNSSTVNIPQKFLAKLNFIHSDTAYVAKLMLSMHRDGEVIDSLFNREGNSC